MYMYIYIYDIVCVCVQAYIDGAAMTGQPRILQQLGVAVLKSEPLRMLANKIAYADPEKVCVLKPCSSMS